MRRAAASDDDHDYFKARGLARACQHGLRNLPPSSAAGLFRVASGLSERVKHARARRELIVSMAKAVAGTRGLGAQRLASRFAGTAETGLGLQNRRSQARLPARVQQQAAPSSAS